MRCQGFFVIFFKINSFVARYGFRVAGHGRLGFVFNMLTRKTKRVTRNVYILTFQNPIIPTFHESEINREYLKDI